MPVSAGRWERLVIAVRQLHSPRVFSGDGYGWTVCAECRQVWPCATENAIVGALSPTAGSDE